MRKNRCSGGNKDYNELNRQGELTTIAIVPVLLSSSIPRQVFGVIDKKTCTIKSLTFHDMPFIDIGQEQRMDILVEKWVGLGRTERVFPACVGNQSNKPLSERDCASVTFSISL